MKAGPSAARVNVAVRAKMTGWEGHALTAWSPSSCGGRTRHASRRPRLVQGTPFALPLVALGTMAGRVSKCL